MLFSVANVSLSWLIKSFMLIFSPSLCLLLAFCMCSPFARSFALLWLSTSKREGGGEKIEEERRNFPLMCCLGIGGGYGMHEWMDEWTIERRYMLNRWLSFFFFSPFFAMRACEELRTAKIHSTEIDEVEKKKKKEKKNGRWRSLWVEETLFLALVS